MKYLYFILIFFIGFSVQLEPDKLNLTIYYSTLSDTSITFLMTQLYPAYKKFHKYVTLDFVPFGHATLNYTKDGSYSFSCADGVADCYGNQVQGCVLLHQGVDDMLKMQFIICYMKCRCPDNFYTCAEEAKLNTTEIASCTKENGTSIMAYYGERTKKEFPNLSYLPAFKFNGKQNLVLDLNIRTDFFKLICQILKNPPECNTRRKRENKERCKEKNSKVALRNGRNISSIVDFSDKVEEDPIQKNENKHVENKDMDPNLQSNENFTDTGINDDSNLQNEDNKDLKEDKSVNKSEEVPINPKPSDEGNSDLINDTSLDNDQKVSISPEGSGEDVAQNVEEQIKDENQTSTNIDKQEDKVESSEDKSRKDYTDDYEELTFFAAKELLNTNEDRQDKVINSQEENKKETANQSEDDIFTDEKHEVKITKRQVKIEDEPLINKDSLKQQEQSKLLFNQDTKNKNVGKVLIIRLGEMKNRAEIIKKPESIQQFTEHHENNESQDEIKPQNYNHETYEETNKEPKKENNAGKYLENIQGKLNSQELAKSPTPLAADNPTHSPDGRNNATTIPSELSSKSFMFTDAITTVTNNDYTIDSKNDDDKDKVDDTIESKENNDEDDKVLFA